MKDQSSEELLDKMSPSASYKLNHQNDEIDLLQLLLRLWEGRKIIILSVVAFVLIGLVYVITKPGSYTLSVNSKVEVYDVEMIKHCQRTPAYIGCLNGQILSHYSKLLPSWNVDKNSSILSKSVNQQNQNLESYQSELDAANANVTQYLLSKTRKHLSMMNSLNPILQGTEVVAENILQAQQALSLLEEEGATAVTFGKPNIEKEPTRASLIIMLSAFLGVFFGILAILLKAVFKELKLRMEDDSVIEK